MQNAVHAADTKPGMQRRRALLVLGSLALLAGAVFAVLPAWTWKWLACENAGTEACGRKDLADVQFTVACIGVLPALLLVVDTLRGSRRALLWLGIGVGVYAAWAVLLDAAIHGWDDLKLLPLGG